MAGATEIFTVETSEAQQSFDITARVREIVARGGIARGLCQVFVLHSTCAVVVNETADPNIGVDVLGALTTLFPADRSWLHNLKDDNADAHMKASVLGPSELIPIVDGELLLGTWQGIWLFEFDGPRTRRVAVHLIEG